MGKYSDVAKGEWASILSKKSERNICNHIYLNVLLLNIRKKNKHTLNSRGTIRFGPTPEGGMPKLGNTF